MNNAHYELRYVAFLDLLGFKSMVEESIINQEVLNNINNALTYNSSMQHDNYHGHLPMVDLGKHITTFSDSIVISYNSSMPGGGFHVLMDLVYICNDLLNIGIPLRGGVTVGELIHNDKLCFGPGMVKAYKMESEIAIFPRIIIDESVLKYDLTKPGEANTVEYEIQYLKNIIKRDSDDGQIFLDYMKQCNEFDEPDMYYDYILRTNEFITHNLVKFANNEKVFAKYEWLKKYYNDTISTFYKYPNKLFIK